MNQVMSIEVADFVEAVDAALADLPAAVRAELLEDLPGHLEDVLADGGTPQTSLGEPAAYAAELRVAAGHPPRSSGRKRSIDLRERLRDADARIGSAIGYERLSDFVRALRPAWWVLRAYLLVQVVTGAHSRTGGGAITPLVGGNVVVGVITVVAASALSIWLGRRVSAGWAATASAVVGLLLLAYSTLIVQYAVRTNTEYINNGDYTDPVSIYTNLYPIGPDGKVIRNVRLIDQDGNPFVLDAGCASEPTVDPPEQDPAQLFPIVCPGADGSLPAGTTVGPLPSAAASSGASGTPQVTAPATPSPPTVPPTKPSTKASSSR